MVRILIPLLVVLALVGALIAVKAGQINLLIQSGQAAQAAGPKPEIVSSARSKIEMWGSALFAVGSVEAERGVTLSTESSGIVTRLSFDSGAEVQAGAVLAELDTSVERAQLKSIEARLRFARSNLERTRALEQERVASASDLDSAESSLGSLQADATALRAQIERKVVRAPFSGRLGIRQINLGQFLSPGTAITTLQSDKEDYVDFALPQKHLDQLRVGLPVRLTAEQSDISLSGVVAAIDPGVNERTRAVTVRASTSDPEKRLRPGMFISVAVELDEKRRVVVVPVTSVVYAPYGDSVFLIEDDPKDATRKLARQQFVRLGETRGDFVEVVQGLSGDETVVSAGAFKLRNGAPVHVNNEVGLAPKTDPKPPNR